MARQGNSSRGGRAALSPPPPLLLLRLFLSAALCSLLSSLLFLSSTNASRLDDITKLTVGPLGNPRFLLGYNMGNVRFLPFARAPLSHSADELRAMLSAALDDMRSQGANAVRFWLHIDGSASPDFDPKTGLVSGISADVLNDLKWFLQSAHDRDIAVVLSLWSHDVLAVRATNSVEHRDRALKMVEDEAGTEAYIKKALVPMLMDLAGTVLLPSSTSSTTMASSSAGAARPDGSPPSMLDAVWAWEIFNEPEGMSFELEGYKNYQYEVERGPYTFENPEVYDAQPKRKLDFQNTTFLKREGGFLRVDPKDSSKALYNGPHFVKRLNGTSAGLNDYMYRDVFAQFNSDFSFLVDAVERGGLATRGASELALSRFHNRVAGAIHRAVPGALVTVAAHSMPYTSDAPMKLEGWRPPARNLYSDAALVAAGGDEDGTLDFYQVHSYPNWQDPKDEFNSQYMPFLNPKSRWQLDKPLLVGEFWDAIGGKGEGTLSADSWYKLFADGYAGGLGWAYFEVTEEFGGAAIVKETGGQPGREPRRTVAKHQMRDRFAPLIREVAARLAEDRAAEVDAALVPPRGMSSAEFAALRGAANANAAAGAGAVGASAAAAAAAAAPVVPPPHSPPSLPSSSSSRFASSDAIAKPRAAFKASSSGASKTKTASASTTSDAATSSDAAAVVAPTAAAAASSSAPVLLSADVAAELAAAFSHAADAARTGGAVSSSYSAPKAAAAAASAAAVPATAAAAEPAAAAVVAAAAAPAATESSSAPPAAAAAAAPDAAAAAAALPIDATPASAAASPLASPLDVAPAPNGDAADADAAAVATAAAAMLSPLDRDEADLPSAAATRASSSSSPRVFSSSYSLRAAATSYSTSPATRAAAGSRAAAVESSRMQALAAADEESDAVDAAAEAVAGLSSSPLSSSSSPSSFLAQAQAQAEEAAENVAEAEADAEAAVSEALLAGGNTAASTSSSSSSSEGASGPSPVLMPSSGGRGGAGGDPDAPAAAARGARPAALPVPSALPPPRSAPATTAPFLFAQPAPVVVDSGRQRVGPVPDIVAVSSSSSSISSSSPSAAGKAAAVPVAQDPSP